MGWGHNGELDVLICCSQSSLEIRNCSRKFFLSSLIWPSTNLEKEEVSSYSCFLLRAKRSTDLFLRAHFPSLLGSSAWMVSLRRLMGRNAAESLSFRSLPFSMEHVLGSASGPRTSVFIVEVACWAIQELQGVSKFTCPAFQANVFDIEQQHSSARFGSVGLECNLEGKSRSDSNVHLPATFSFFKKKFLLILR